MSTRKLLEVAREQAILREERCPGYRAELIKCLTRVIGAQDEGASTRARREKVAKEVRALAQRVASKGGGER